LSKAIRILWVSHDPVRSSAEKVKSNSGFWKESLLYLLNSNPLLDIKVAFPGKQPTRESYTFRLPNKSVYVDLPSITCKDLQWIAGDFKPDLIHIHGTEKPYGLIKNYIATPVVISLQGFLSKSFNAVLGEIPLPVWQKKKTLKEMVFRNDFLNMHKNWYHNSFFEKKIASINLNFIGRTDFDKDFLQEYNPEANYFLGNELLRDNFFDKKWDIKNINRYSIYCSSFTNPLKGFHILLDAAYYLKKEFPAIKIVVPGIISKRMGNRFLGNSYFRIIAEKIKQYDLADNISFQGSLNGEQISNILFKTHVFVLPSFIENSSNALGEAQVAGVPCVVSNCGGTTSIIQENKNGVYFLRGDAFSLANKIRSVFLNDELAMELSKNATIFGLHFHDKVKIYNQYSTIYQNIVDENII
jgi:glycosyltransferase involved in cell wall biosynthesis